MDLRSKKCIPCEKGVPALTREQAQAFLKDIRGWTLAHDARSISKEYLFVDFRHALSFINEIGDIAEFEGHHPDLNLHNWNKVTVSLSTHTLKGLSENDFIMAAKIDAVTHENEELKQDI